MLPLCYLGQGRQQPLRVVQGGPAVRQTVGHVSQLLPDRRKSDLDVGQTRPVQLGPALQVAEHRQSFAVQILNNPGRSTVKHFPGKNPQVFPVNPTKPQNETEETAGNTSTKLLF